MKGQKVWLLAGVTAVLDKQKQFKSMKLYQNTAPAQIGTAWTPSWSQIQAGFVKPVSSSLRHRLKKESIKRHWWFQYSFMFTLHTDKMEQEMFLLL